MSPRPIRLPKDALPHNTSIEWWYWNGHLRSVKNPSKQYAFMDCFFRADADKVKIPYLKNPFKRSRYLHFAHSIVSDLGTKKSYKDVQGISFLSGDSFTRPLLYINYSDPLALPTPTGYVNNEMAEIKPGKFHVKTGMMDIELWTDKQPLLEGGKGFVTVGGRSSYYYSLTDLEVRGTVRIGVGASAKLVEVEGKAWMDHQWANVAYGRDKWTWFALKFDDGTDIMCVEYANGKRKDSLVDMKNRSGKTEHYKELTLVPGKRVWQSKTTKAKYPLSWRIGIPGVEGFLTAEAVVGDQEMVSGEINYWEGPVVVQGTIRGKHVKGKGFMELVGYPADYNALVLMGRELYKNIKKTAFPG